MEPKINYATDTAARGTISNPHDHDVTINLGWKRPLRLRAGEKYITLSQFEIGDLWHPGARLRGHLAALGLEVTIDWERRGEPIPDPFAGQVLEATP